MEAGELSRRTWLDYQSIMEKLLQGIGARRLVSDLDPSDFAALKKKLAKDNGPHRMCTIIQVIRCAFKHAYDSDALDRPMHFGPNFKRTSKKTIRLHRAKQGAKLFTADEIRRMIGAATVPMRAMVLLGINCGFGNSDCGNLPLSAVDLDKGIIDYPRPKTGIARRCVLWPETVAALRNALASRPNPKAAEHAGLVFITKYGSSWFRDDAVGPLTWETKKLMNRLGINGHRCFYTLRHTFRTVADEAKDQVAADYIMGHEVPHMSTAYRETISDARLRSVADHVRCWLFNDSSAPQEPAAWTLPPQSLDAERSQEDAALSESEQSFQSQYSLGKANYKQVVLAKRLMTKGWSDPYYYRGCVWLTSPADKHDRQSQKMRRCSALPIRVTKTGRILRGW